MPLSLHLCVPPSIPCIPLSILCLHPCSAWELLSHQDITVSRLSSALPSELGSLREDPTLVRRLDIEGHYSAMVSRQEYEVESIKKSEGMQLPLDLPYHK